MGNVRIGEKLHIGSAVVSGLGQDGTQRVVIGGGDELQIRTTGGEFVDRSGMGNRCDHGLALRRARGCRRPLDREYLPMKSM
jgi:hypothetical protein